MLAAWVGREKINEAFRQQDGHITRGAIAPN